MHSCMHVCSKYVCKCVYMYVSVVIMCVVYMFACMQICVHIYVYVCMCVCRPCTYYMIICRNVYFCFVYVRKYVAIYV